MKRELKNLIGPADLKKLYENNIIENNNLFRDYQVNINESMEFGNRTGFGESLVGRAINKIFSFVATRIEYQILNSLTKQINKVYDKAVLTGIGVYQKSNAGKKSDSTTTTTTSTSSSGSSQADLISQAFAYGATISLETNHTITSEMTQILHLQEQQIELSEEIMELEISIQRKRTITLIKQQQEDEEKIVIFKVAQDQKQNLNNQVISLMSLFNKIKKDDLNKDDNMKMLSTIITKLDNEIDETEDGNNKNALVRFQKDIRSHVDSTTDVLSDAEWEARAKEPKMLPEDINDVDKKIVDLFNKSTTLSKTTTDHEKSKKLTFVIGRLDPEKVKNLSDDEKIELLKSVEDYITTEKIFDNVTFTEIDKLNEDTAIISQEDNLEAQLKLKKQKMNILIKSITAEQNKKITENFNEKVTISSFGIEKDDSSAMKDFFQDNKTVTVETIKSDYENYDEEKKKTCCNLICANVNHELIKEIGYKADALYNLDNYKDERSDKIYSRVNFSTTQPDKKKLHNKWNILCSQIKGKYTPYFSTNGIFPGHLDPQALLYADKTFRDKYEEFCNSNCGTQGGECKDETTDRPNKFGDGDGDNLCPVKCVLDTIGLKANINMVNNFVAFSVDYSKGHIYAILNKIKDKNYNFNGYHFSGLIDFKEIDKQLQECENKKQFNDQEIDAIMNPYIYNDINQINQNTNYDDNSKKQLVRIFENFRPSGSTADDKTIFVTEKGNMKNRNKNEIMMCVFNNKTQSLKISKRDINSTDGERIEMVDYTDASILGGKIEKKHLNYVYKTSGCVFGVSDLKKFQHLKLNKNEELHDITSDMNDGLIKILKNN